VENGSVTQSFNYDQGQAECEKIGTGLAIIRNQSDYNALMSTINKSGILLSKKVTVIWISGRKSLGSWKWYTGEVIPIHGSGILDNQTQPFTHAPEYTQDRPHIKSTITCVTPLLRNCFVSKRI